MTMDVKNDMLLEGPQFHNRVPIYTHMIVGIWDP